MSADRSDRKFPNDSPVRDDVREHLVEVADILAKVLDTTVRIPGTSLSIGFDPLIGLIPGVGDAIANLIGTVILGIAARLRLPRIVLARMSLNLLINGTVGAVRLSGATAAARVSAEKRCSDLLGGFQIRHVVEFD